MAVPDSLPVIVNSAAAAVLFVAGIAKAVSPGQLGRSLNDLVRLPGRGITARHVRVFAAVELLTALALTAAATQPAAAWAVGLLGAAFALAGALGMLRGGGTACGCFGGSADRPLGPVNIAVGVLLMAVPAVNLTPVSGAASAYFFQAATGLAGGALLLCLWVHRGLIKDFTRPLPASR
ncbi:MauE/DoxX family redox-associated membrane protein [Actinomadura sp. 6K520]|uniref:MauE/DoxX family redox-associated membrane protein n=1 Tax=Actinomadura sp. 6K520 TaxID=2530364 RepID=UPI001404FA0F|nr:MauE/DoxX family redox-associated membrane protein [Actinomadura sp. 6K520]